MPDFIQRLEIVDSGDPSRLVELGFSEFFEHQVAELGVAAQGLLPARVSACDHGLCQLVGVPAGRAELAGSVRQQLQNTPIATGDWVLVSIHDEHATIRAVLNRRTVLGRRAVGLSGSAQTLVANVDTVFIVTSANRDFSPRRLERYLIAVWDSGARPIVVLNKVDLTEDLDEYVRQVQMAAPGVALVAVSAQQHIGIDELRAYLTPGHTFAFLGSSGVGKSSLVNCLLGERRLKTSGTDDTGKGRHTTTRRQLLVVPGAGVLIDTPGMREFGLLDQGAGFDVTFAEIAELAQQCRFRDCQHESEPGCAVVHGVKHGRLSAERLTSYHKLQRELQFLTERHEPAAQARYKRRMKVLSKEIRRRTKPAGGRRSR